MTKRSQVITKFHIKNQQIIKWMDPHSDPNSDPDPEVVITPDPQHCLQLGFSRILGHTLYIASFFKVSINPVRTCIVTSTIFGHILKPQYFFNLWTYPIAGLLQYRIRIHLMCGLLQYLDMFYVQPQGFMSTAIEYIYLQVSSIF